MSLAAAEIGILSSGIGLHAPDGSDPSAAESRNRIPERILCQNLLINTVLAAYVGGAGYRSEWPAFQQAVETPKNDVVRAAASQHAETGWGKQLDVLHVRETSMASEPAPKKSR